MSSILEQSNEGSGMHKSVAKDDVSSCRASTRPPSLSESERTEKLCGDAELIRRFLSGGGGAEERHVRVVAGRQGLILVERQQQMDEFREE